MLTIIIFAIIPAIIMSVVIYNEKWDFCFECVLAVFAVSLLGIELGLITSAVVGTQANEQNSQITYVEQIELVPYNNNDNNIYLKTENDDYYLSTKSTDPVNPNIESHKGITNINFNNNVAPYVKIVHMEPPLIIKLFGVFYETKYYYYTIPENGLF